MILVIAIILILAAAVALSVNDILANARAGESSVSNRVEEISQGIYASESKLGNYGF